MHANRGREYLNKDSPDNSSWKAWAIGLGVGAVALGGVFLLKSMYDSDIKKKKFEKKKKKREQKKISVVKSNPKSESKTQTVAAAASSTTTPSATTTVATTNPTTTVAVIERQSNVNIPPEPELFQAILNSLESLQRTNEGVNQLDQQVLQWTRNMVPSKYSPKCRLIAAQWFILYHTVRTVTLRPEEAKAVLEAQTKDMAIAWELLDMPSLSSEENQAADLLRLDVGQRLKDHYKMAPVFDRIIARGESMTYEDIVVSFTTAPLLGRWSIVRRLGDKIVQQQGSLEEFHRAALQRPDIPDYEVLYQLAATEQERGDTPMEHLIWQTYRIVSVKVRFQDVQCQDEEKAEALRNSAANSSHSGWNDLPASRHARLLRFGGIAQLLSFNAMPIPMVGPATKDRMKVLGYVTVPVQTGTMKQTELYDLSCNQDDPNVWTGRYTLIQEEGEEPVTDSVKLIFDMQMKLEEIDN